MMAAITLLPAGLAFPLAFGLAGLFAAAYLMTVGRVAVEPAELLYADPEDCQGEHERAGDDRCIRCGACLHRFERTASGAYPGDPCDVCLARPCRTCDGAAVVLEGGPNTGEELGWAPCPARCDNGAEGEG